MLPMAACRLRLPAPLRSWRGLALAVAFRSDRSARASVACARLAAGRFLILVSPHYPWYFLVLVPLLAIHPSATAWVLTLACPLLYDSVEATGWPGYDARIAIFIAATLLALAHDAWRRAAQTSRTGHRRDAMSKRADRSPSLS